MEDIMLIVFIVVTIIALLIAFWNARYRLPKSAFEPHVYIDEEEPRIEFFNFHESRNSEMKKFYKEYYVGLVIAYNDRNFVVTKIDKVLNSNAKSPKRNMKMVVYLKEKELAD